MRTQNTPEPIKPEPSVSPWLLRLAIIAIAVLLQLLNFRQFDSKPSGSETIAERPSTLESRDGVYKEK